MVGPPNTSNYQQYIISLVQISGLCPGGSFDPLLTGTLEGRDTEIPFTYTNAGGGAYTGLVQPPPLVSLQLLQCFSVNDALGVATTTLGQILEAFEHLLTRAASVLLNYYDGLSTAVCVAKRVEANQISINIVVTYPDGDTDYFSTGLLQAGQINSLGIHGR